MFLNNGWFHSARFIFRAHPAHEILVCVHALCTHIDFQPFRVAHIHNKNADLTAFLKENNL